MMALTLAASALAACQIVSGLSAFDEEPAAFAGAKAATDAEVPSSSPGASPSRGGAADAGAGDGDVGGDGTPTEDGSASTSGAGSASSPSCQGLAATCGTYDTPEPRGVPESCCTRKVLPAGSTSRTFGYVDGGLVGVGAPAQISAVALDRFEVSVGRFSRFLDAFDKGYRPPAVAGRAPKASNDRGWTFEQELPSDLRARIAACDGTMLRADPRAPMNCVTYAEAFAFCIYDGGRLPTEAEWAFAAAGGGELRIEPASVPPSHEPKTGVNAFSTGPTLVGAFPEGDGRFGHADLLGNVAEWVRDAFVDPYPAGTCIDCLVDVPNTPRSVRGNSFYTFDWTELRSTVRKPLDARTRSEELGVRCAYDLP